jgi:hypothetical protein
VPKTGKTTIHSGEAVIPAEQVDEPLLAYLRRDAMMKGVPLGHGSQSKGYAEGNLGEGWETLRRWLGGAGATQGGMQEWQSRYGPEAVPPKGLGNLPVPTGPGGQGEWVSGGFQHAPGSVDPETLRRFRELDEAIKAASPADRKLLEAGRERLLLASGEGAGLGRIPEVTGLGDELGRLPVTGATRGAAPTMAMRGAGKAATSAKVAEALGDDAVKALRKTSKGRLFLGSAIGTAALVGASAGEPSQAERVLPWMRFDVMAQPWVMLQEMLAQKRAGREGPEAVGAGVRTAVGELGREALGPVAPFARGLAPGMMEPGVEETEPAAVGDQGSDEFVGPPEGLPPAPTLEGALGRVAEGDFGTPEAPLQLTGEAEPDFPESYEDLRALPENITAQHKAKMNMVQAEKMMDHLQFHGHELSPDAYQQVTDQIKMKTSLADMYGKQVQSREKFAQQGQKLMQDLSKKLVEIEARGDQQRTTEELRQQNREDLVRLRGSSAMVRTLVNNMVSKESGARRDDAKQLLIQIIQNLQRYKGVNVAADADVLDRLDAMETAGQEDVEMFISGLENALSELR